MSAEPLPTVSPFLFCSDVVASRDFLVAAFGADERDLVTDDAGTAHLATVSLGRNTVYLSRAHRDRMEPPGPSSLVHALVMIYVADVDAFFDRARTAGAVVEYEPTDMPYGQRECGLRDRDGHYWCVATTTR